MLWPSVWNSLGPAAAAVPPAPGRDGLRRCRGWRGRWRSGQHRVESTCALGFCREGKPLWMRAAAVYMLGPGTVGWLNKNTERRHVRYLSISFDISHDSDNQRLDFASSVGASRGWHGRQTIAKHRKSVFAFRLSLEVNVHQSNLSLVILG